MEIGIAFDLRADFDDVVGGPEDRLEEYDSEATVNAIAAALESAGHRPRPLGGGRRFLEAVMKAPPQLVFNIAEGRATRSREAHVPSACEMLGIPVTHSDPLTLAVSLDKAIAKRLVAAVGVPTPRFAVVDGDDTSEAAKLACPVIAKPLFEGSSMGVRWSSKIRTPGEIAGRCRSLRADYGEPVLVEEFLPGAEFTVGITGNGAGAKVVGIMEIIPKRKAVEDFVYGLEAKRNYLEEVEYAVPPRRDAALLKRISGVALGAYRALGCRDISRVDVRLDAAGAPHFLEVNPLPGLNPVTGDIVILSGRMGVPFEKLIAGIVDDARARYGV